MSTESVFLDCAVRRLDKSCRGIEKCIPKIPADKLWARDGENLNAPGNLLLHLNGNIRQWILSGVFGDADHRDRDSEFAARSGPPAAELMARLRATVDETKSRLKALPEETLVEIVRPQGYEVTKLEAIFHVVEHFCGHAYQIYMMTKMITGENLGFYAHLSKNRPAKAASDPTP